jgi:hypothetical protein
MKIRGRQRSGGRRRNDSGKSEHPAKFFSAQEHRWELTLGGNTYCNCP